MIIGIQKGLEDLKMQLEEKGYHVIYADQYAQPFDAYIYVGYGKENILENIHIPTMTSTSIQHGELHSGGVLLINAIHKDIYEIEHILQRKTYSPLFE